MSDSSPRARWERTLDHIESSWKQALEQSRPTARTTEVGFVVSTSGGVAQVSGLPKVGSNELVYLDTQSDAGLVPGLALNLDQDSVGVVLLGTSQAIEAGVSVHRTGRVLDVPVGEGLLGRVVDPLGNPLDARGVVRYADRYPIERDAPGILHRAPVTRPLQTGIKVIDALVPIGRGQRELIVGDRQTGKTAVALDAIINQADQDVVCIYCAIAQRSASVARVIADLEAHGAMAYTIVLVAGGDDPPGLQFVAPYAATAMGEYFCERGRDVLLIYDDLTRHAVAYRELSLLLRRPPGREAFPGDVFYIHSRLLERATQLNEAKGGGSLTALPVVETEAQNISAYIPTNLISITDGQVFLSPRLYRKGVFPAVDVGRSVSRVGGQSQLPAYRRVVRDLRLSYAQFEELEMFARFGTRLDHETRRALVHGRSLRALLMQPQYRPIPVAEQIALITLGNTNMLDDLPRARVEELEAALAPAMRNGLAAVAAEVHRHGTLSAENTALIIAWGEQQLASSSAAVSFERSVDE